MIAFGYGVAAVGDLADAGWLHGLKIVAVAVVAQAVWGMAKNLCPDRERLAIAAAATVLALTVPSTLGQVGAIVAGGLIGWFFLPGEAIAFTPLPVRISRLWSIGAIVLFFALLFGLPLLPCRRPAATRSRCSTPSTARARWCSAAAMSCCRLLQAATVQPGWVGNDAFLAGYGAAQAVPGPLFTFAAYLGTVMNQPPNGWIGRPAVPRRHLPAVVLPGDRPAAVLELVPPASGDALGAARA